MISPSESAAHFLFFFMVTELIFPCWLYMAFNYSELPEIDDNQVSEKL